MMWQLIVFGLGNLKQKQKEKEDVWEWMRNDTFAEWGY